MARLYDHSRYNDEMRIRPLLVIGLPLLFLQSGCGEAAPNRRITEIPGGEGSSPQSTANIGATPLPPTIPVDPSSTPVLASPTATAPRPSPTAPPTSQICSPMDGIPLVELEGAITNPFNPPLPSSDDPHQGIDLAYRMPGTGIALAGEPVFAVLGGQVVSVISDRFPYGNAIMIETPPGDLPPRVVGQLPDKATPQVSITLTCPDIELPLPGGEGRSLYTLYAHFDTPPDLRVGDELACGALIGTTGDSGNALNPHLHIEMRVGPSGASFESMAHYETRANDVEMANYCLWRVSGEFVLVDPVVVLRGE